MGWYLQVLRQYAVFSGRARRQEFWVFTLFNILISVALAALDALMGTYDSEVGLGLLGIVYGLAVLLPALGVAIRRLHDVNRSGWWLLIAFIPFLGALVLLLFMVTDSSPGSNRFGENPKFN